MTAIRSCKCGHFKWAEGHDRIGFHVEVSRDPFALNTGATPTLSLPCPRCGAGPDGKTVDMAEHAAMFRGACEVNRAR